MTLSISNSSLSLSDVKLAVFFPYFLYDLPSLLNLKIKTDKKPWITSLLKFLTIATLNSALWNFDYSFPSWSSHLLIIGFFSPDISTCWIQSKAYKMLNSSCQSVPWWKSLNSYLSLIFLIFKHLKGLSCFSSVILFVWNIRLHYLFMADSKISCLNEDENSIGTYSGPWKPD